MNVRTKGNLIIEMVEKLCFDSSILVLHCVGFFALPPKLR